jgi:hypothetical protein
MKYNTLEWQGCSEVKTLKCKRVVLKPFHSPRAEREGSRENIN